MIRTDTKVLNIRKTLKLRGSNASFKNKKMRIKIDKLVKQYPYDVYSDQDDIWIMSWLLICVSLFRWKLSIYLYLILKMFKTAENFYANDFCKEII